MTIIIAIALVATMALLGAATYGAYRIYARLKEIEKNLITEVAQTKQSFKDLVDGILPNEEDKPKGARTIDAEEIDE